MENYHVAVLGKKKYKGIFAFDLFCFGMIVWLLNDFS